MPPEFKGPRVEKVWREDRKRWRVLTVYADKTKVARLFENEADADGWVTDRRNYLARLGEVTFERAIDLYTKERLVGLEPVTAIETDRRMREFFGPILRQRVAAFTEKRGRELYFGRWDADRLVEDGLVTRIRERTGKPYAVDSQRNILAETKTFLRWCVRKEFIGESPIEKLGGIGRRNPGGLGENRLTRKELRAIYRQCLLLGPGGDEGAVAVLFALYFAMRAKEIVTRQCRHIDEETWAVEVDKRTGKTDNAERGLAVPKRLRPVVLKMMKGKRAEQFVFGRGDKHRTRDFVNRSLKRICKLVGVDPKKARAHALRGAHNDLAKADGQTADAIDRQLGHKKGGRTRDRSYTSDIGRKAGQREKADAVFKVLEGGRASGGKGRR